MNETNYLWIIWVGSIICFTLLLGIAHNEHYNAIVEYKEVPCYDRHNNEIGDIKCIDEITVFENKPFFYKLSISFITMLTIVGMLLIPLHFGLEYACDKDWI